MNFKSFYWKSQIFVFNPKSTWVAMAIPVNFPMRAVNNLKDIAEYKWTFNFYTLLKTKMFSALRSKVLIWMI